MTASEICMQCRKAYGEHGAGQYDDLCMTWSERDQSYKPDGTGNKFLPAPKPIEPAQVESVEVELYYVQDTRQYCGNSCFWWKPNGNGYTCDLDEAWKVSKEKAESMMRRRPGVDVAWPVTLIDSGTARHFDMQKLRESKSL